MGSLFVQLLLLVLIGVYMDVVFCAITHIQRDEETQKKSVNVNLDDDFVNYGRSGGERHRVTVNSSIDDSIFVEVQLKGGINITVIEDNNNNVTTRVIAEETNIVTKKFILQDSPNEVEDITNKINELISSNNDPLGDTIKELKVAQDTVRKMLEINSSPHDIERLEYLLIILKTSIAEKTKENENIERISKLTDLVTEQLENPQKISEFDLPIETIVIDIEELAETVKQAKVIQEKVKAVLSKFKELNGKRKSVVITDNSKIDRLMELKEILNKESFSTMELNRLENIYDEILELQIHLSDSNYSSLADKLENEALMLFQNVKLFDDIDRRMIADVDLNDLNDLEKNLLELLGKINNPIAIENIRSKLTEMRDTLRTYYGMDNNVEPHIALNHIENVLNNRVVLGGIKSLKDIHLVLTEYLKTATNEDLKNQAMKLLVQAKEMIDDLEIAQRILDEVTQSLNQTHDENTVKTLLGHKSSLVEIMNTIKDQQMVITAKKMLFDIQEVVTQFNTVKQIMNIRRAALEIDESLDAEIVENPIEIYKRIEKVEKEAKELSKSNINPTDKQKVDEIVDVSRNLKVKLSEASSTLFKSMDNLIKLINTLKMKNLPMMRENYDQVVKNFERFNDTMRNEAIGGLEERLDMVHTDYYRIYKSLENVQQKLSSFSLKRKQSSITYPLPVDQKKANDILSKLEATMTQPNVTENIMTTRKILLDIKHAEETLSQAKNILEHFNNFNEHKVIDNSVVPEEKNELNIKKKMQNSNFPEYTDYLQETNSTFIDYLEDVGTNLKVPANEPTELKLQSSESEDESVVNVTNEIPVSITTESEDQVTEIISFDEPVKTKPESEEQEQENITSSDLVDTTIEELMTESATNVDMNITTESALIEDEHIEKLDETQEELQASVNEITENESQETYLRKSETDETTDEILSTTPENISFEISTTNEDQVEEIKTKDSLEDTTTEREDTTTEYESSTEIPSETDHRKIIQDEDSLEMKKPIKDINNDLIKITEIKNTAKNYSATINNNIIVNLKSINSTDFNTNLLENNMKALLEDSINVNETIAQTRTYLDEIRPEVTDDQQWILEQLQSYLLNVELDSLTSKLIADIKTLLSNFNN
ncbi:unnamed protein product [Diamesa tonsa]